MIRWVDNRGSIRVSADERILVKALPGGRSGHRGRRGGGGVGLQGSAELQVAAQEVKRGKPEGDRRAVGLG